MAGSAGGYTTAYHKLVRGFGGDTRYMRLVLAALMFANPVWVVLVFGALVTLGRGAESETAASLSVIAFLLLIPLALMVLVWLAYLGWIAGRDTRTAVARLAASLLVAEPRPHDETRGYAYEDLARLQEVASVVQRSAAWRCGYLAGSLIFTLLLLFLAAEAASAGWISWRSADSHLPAWLNSLALLGFFLLVALLFFMLIQLGNYSFDFFAAEPATRALLLACVEAQALLAGHGLQEREQFTRVEKRWLAAQCGYRLQTGEGDRPLFVDGNGRRWFLVPIS